MHDTSDLSCAQQRTERIALLEGLRDDLSSCIGCGCLSLQACHLYNPSDAAAAHVRTWRAVCARDV